MKENFDEDRKCRVRGIWNYLLKKNIDWLIYKVPHVHCGKNLLKEKIFVNYQWFHHSKKSKVKLFPIYVTSENQNWFKLCYCSLFGVFYMPVSPY